MHASESQSRVAGFFALRYTMNWAREMSNKYVSVVVTSSRLETKRAIVAAGRRATASVVNHFILYCVYVGDRWPAGGHKNGERLGTKDNTLGSRRKQTEEGRSTSHLQLTIDECGTLDLYQLTSFTQSSKRKQHASIIA